MIVFLFGAENLKVAAEFGSVKQFFPMKVVLRCSSSIRTYSWGYVSVVFRCIMILYFAASKIGFCHQLPVVVIIVKRWVGWLTWC